MIILLTESDLVRSQPLSGHSCPNCGKTDSLEMELRQRYAEFGTGKVYPEGVVGVVHCLICGHTIPASRWTDDLHRAFISLKTGYKTPRKYWNGLIRVGYGIVAFFAIFGMAAFLLGWQRTAENDEMQKAWQAVLTQPKPGTTLAVGNGVDTNFEVWRVSRAGNGTVWLKTYTGSRILTDFFHETGWSTLPDSEFANEAVGYSATKFADKCLMRSADVNDLTKHCEYSIFAVLDK